MQPITPTLLAAARRAAPGGIPEPTLRVIVTDQPCERPRWVWSSVYGPSGEDGPHGVAQLRAGPLLRARQSPGGGLYIQRLVDPSSPSAWSAWTTLLGPGQCFVAAGLALTASTVADLARLFWVDADGRTVRCAETTDGVGWIEEVVVVEPSPRQVRGLAADLTAGDAHLILVVDWGTGGADEYLVALERVGGVWTNRREHGTGRWSTAGVCAARDEAVASIYVGVADGGGASGLERRIAYQEYDAAGNSWLGGTVLLTRGADSGFTPRAPRLRLAGNGYPRHVHGWVESFAGSGPQPAYDRPMVAVTPQRYWPTEVVPWSSETAHGLALLRTASGTWYLVGARQAWSAPSYTAAIGERVDISADVADLRIAQTAATAPTRAAFVLRDAAGRYSAAGAPGATLALRQGSQIAVRIGYRTSAGDEGVWEAPLWIESVSHHVDGREAALEIEATDAWGLLDGLETAATVQFPGPTALSALLDRALWRVTGVQTTGAAGLGAVLTNTVWTPGRAWGAIARDLCGLAGILVRFRTLQSAPDGSGPTSVVTEALDVASAAPVYAYGQGGHPLTAYRLGSGGQRLTHVSVQGARSGPYAAEAHDWNGIGLLWRRLTRALTDLRLASTADAQRAADAALIGARAAGGGGWIQGPPLPGQETGDVVTVTDQRAGLAATPFRIVGRELRFRRGRGSGASARLVLERT